MARRKYGSKAAYEAERGAIRDERREWERKWNMSDAEREAEDQAEKKQYVKRRLEDPEHAMMLFTGFMMASIASGADPKKAAGAADAAVAEIKKRFT
jgi:hypothetical protein